MLFDLKQPGSFCSAKWKTTTNPDLAFVNGNAPIPHQTILEPFPNSQRRPSVIEQIQYDRHLLIAE